MVDDSDMSRQLEKIVKFLGEKTTASYTDVRSNFSNYGELELYGYLSNLLSSGVIEAEGRNYRLTKAGRSYYKFWKEHEDGWFKLMASEDSPEHNDYERFLDEHVDEELSNKDPEWGEATKDPELMTRFFDGYEIKA